MTARTPVSYRVRPLLVLVVFLLSCSSGTFKSERSQTASLLGVTVVDFPDPQGLTKYDVVPPNGQQFNHELIAPPFDIDEPQEWFERKPSVIAIDAEGNVWEAFCGKAGRTPEVPEEIDFRSEGEKNQPRFVEQLGTFESTPDNARQRYQLHHGYAFNPLDIFIGKREGDRLKTVLFFRDVGSHTTAPHHFSIDGAGRAHLIVADVNISDDNHMDLYWMVGDLLTGKWLSATLVEQRTFTSVSHPWTGVSGDKVHLVWNWDAGEKANPADGLFHVERSGASFGRKIQVVSGEVQKFDSAVDPETGRLLVVYDAGFGGGLYAVMRSPDGKWTAPTLLDPNSFDRSKFRLAPAGNDVFVLRTDKGTQGIRAR